MQDKWTILALVIAGLGWLAVAFGRWRAHEPAADCMAFGFIFLALAELYVRTSRRGG